MEPTILQQESELPSNSGRWLTHEFDLFVRYYDVYGKDWKAIAAEIKTRTPQQVRSHAQKYLAKKQRKEKEQLEVQEAQEMIPDALGKRLTRKKTRKINYREKDLSPDPNFLQLERRTAIKKEREIEKSTPETQVTPKINVSLQTELPPEEPSLVLPPLLPFMYNCFNPWILGNGGIWIP